MPISGRLPLLLASWPALAGCHGEGPAAPPPAALGAMDVEVVTAATTPIADAVTAYGTLDADEEVDLAFEHPGTLAALYVDLGSSVPAGTLLASLDVGTFELEARVAAAAVRQARARLGLDPDGADDRVDPEQTPAVRQARATLTEARLALERVQALERQSLTAEATVENARAAFEVAESRLASAFNEVRDQVVALAQRRVEAQLARRRIDQSELHAPFAGAVAARRRTPPEYVRAGDPVVTLLRTDPLRLRLRIPERDAARVAVGQNVRFVAEGIDGEHAGSVQRLSPRIDPDTRTLLIEATVANPQDILRAGLFARARVDVGEPRPQVTVPASAVVSFAGVDKVFLVAGDRAEERVVTLGRRVGDRVEVSEGLAAGTPVVRQPDGLVSGRALRVKER
ncbi:MAG: efflux RND transporter periplasmic adaptor subunit [Planctomycetota bacterium]